MTATLPLLALPEPDVLGWHPVHGTWHGYTPEAVRALVAERDALVVQACAKVCEAEASDPEMCTSFADTHTDGWVDGCTTCAAAIRSLKEQPEQPDSGHSASGASSEASTVEPGSTAEHCQRLGLSVGDTIFGREEGPQGCWHEALLTLLWVGREEAMWSVKERTDERPMWTETDREAGDWCLDEREWRKVAAAPHLRSADTGRHRSNGLESAPGALKQDHPESAFDAKEDGK